MSGKKCVLVTGGAGYIGSHCCVDLLDAGYDVVVVSVECLPRPVPEHLKQAEAKKSEQDPAGWKMVIVCWLRVVYCVLYLSLHRASLFLRGYSSVHITANPAQFESRPPLWNAQQTQSESQSCIHTAR